MACPVPGDRDGVARTRTGGRAAASRAASKSVSPVEASGAKSCRSHVGADRVSCCTRRFPAETRHHRGSRPAQVASCLANLHGERRRAGAVVRLTEVKVTRFRPAGQSIPAGGRPRFPICLDDDEKGLAEIETSVVVAVSPAGSGSG